MQVEAALIQQNTYTHGLRSHKAGTLQTELRAWRRLFSPKLRPRTLIGVFMMVFQRMHAFLPPIAPPV